MKEIILTKNKVTFVDDEDYEKLNQHKWHCTYYGYAARRSNNKILYMHRELMGNPSLLVDHKNRDPLDNRKSNLRLCDKRLNASNSKINTRNSSGYRGVYWSKPRSKWIAAIQHKGKMFNLGGFSSIKDAAKAYNHAAKKYRGEFATLNEI